MTASGMSSGRLGVDRRMDFAEGLALAGELPAAVEVLSDAMALTPDWAAGWFRLGEWQAAAGDGAAAAVSWDRAVAADPADTLGAAMKRDLLRAVPVAEDVPPAFVEALFDQYAPRFEESLCNRLDYCAPELLAEALGERRFGRALDLGCGTGLAGAALRGRCGWLEGYDISAGMLALAAEKGVYDRLEKRDLTRLETGEARFDLIVAADVFAYIGALEQILGWCTGALAPGGVLAFTVEAADAPLVLRDSRRFAHSQAYVEGLLATAGLKVAEIAPAMLRKDRGADVAGLVVVAEAVGARVLDRDAEGDAIVA